MMGVGNLRKGASNVAATSHAADEFINAAKVDGKKGAASGRPASSKTYKRVTFSLTDELDREIDRLSLIPRRFRASKSDVIRAAVALLAEQDENEVSRLLQSVQVKQLT